MNGNKAALTLVRIFNILFFLTFSVLTLEIVFRRYGEDIYTCDYKQHLLIILVALILLILAVFLFRFVSGKKTAAGKRLKPHADAEKKTEKSTLPVIFIAASVILLLQILFAYLLWCRPVSDGMRIFTYASDFAVNGDFGMIQTDLLEGETYLIRHPQNHMMLFLNAFVYRLWYLLTGRVSRLPMLGLNILSLNAALLFTALLARKTYGDKKALYVLGFSALFAPYYTYTAYIYSDSLSLPYGVGAALILAHALQQKKTVPRLILFALCGGAVFLGFKMKGNLIILAVAILIYLLLKLRLRRFLSAALAFLVGFGCLYGVYTAAHDAAHLSTKEQSYAYELPETHWIMMGLSGNGGFNMDDFLITNSVVGKQEKREKNLEVISQRLGEMGPTGLLQHLTTKAVWTWGDGTYYISGHIHEYIERHAVHDYVLDDGAHHDIFFILTGGFQLLLLILMALSALRGALSPRCDLTLLFRIAVFGIFLFLLIWETRSRYLFNFTPFFLLLTADGADFGAALCKRFREEVRNEL